LNDSNLPSRGLYLTIAEILVFVRRPSASLVFDEPAVIAQLAG
jgi:hypothetical protein